MLETARNGGDAGFPQECSSIGRAPVSKTGGRRFEPCHSCQQNQILSYLRGEAKNIRVTIRVTAVAAMPLVCRYPTAPDRNKRASDALGVYGGPRRVEPTVADVAPLGLRHRSRTHTDGHLFPQRIHRPYPRSPQWQRRALARTVHHCHRVLKQALAQAVRWKITGTKSG